MLVNIVMRINTIEILIITVPIFLNIIFIKTNNDPFGPIQVHTRSMINKKNINTLQIIIIQL